MIAGGSTPTPELSAVRGVVFDLDGTLVDSYAAIADALNRARARFDLGALTLADVRRAVGHGLEQLIADLVGPDRVPEGVRLFRERYAEIFLERTSALPGAGETLALLDRRGYRLSVASNKPARFTRPILERLDMLEHVCCVMGPDVAGVAKPDPEMMRRCLASMDLTETETLYVGDMVLDVETADRAGLGVVLVRGGSSADEELASTGRIVLSSIGGLADLLPDLLG